MTTRRKYPIRVGKRLGVIEKLWESLPKEHHTESVLLALCTAGGISEEPARERFRQALTLLRDAGRL